MKWGYSPIGVLDMLSDYHLNTYPDDNQADWKLHYSAEHDRDAYVMVLQYKNPGRLGHLYAKRHISGMAACYFEQANNIAGWTRFIIEEFDAARMEIIETLDEQMTRPPKFTDGVA